MGDDVLKTKGKNASQEISEESNYNEKATSEQINKIISELNDLINNIKNSRQISQAVAQSEALNPSQATNPSQPITQGQTPTQIQQTIEGQAPTQSQVTEATAVNVNATIIQTAQTLAALNSIKADLCRLPLDFCEREYIANCINPLVTAMEFLSRTGFDLSTSASILTSSPIVPRKKGKLKDTIHIVYSINEECGELYEVLKKRFKKLTENDNCCRFP